MNGSMNDRATVNTRIREISSTCTIQHRVIVHYSNSRDVVGDVTAVVVDKNVEEVVRYYKF